MFVILAVFLCAGQVWGADVVVTLDNIGASLGSTANTSASTTDITATGTSDSYTLNYYQCKKQGNAMLMTKSVNPYISNKTPMPGNIKSVEVFINSGASGKTTYNCAFSATECNAYNAATGIGAQNITGGNSHIFNANVDGKYFLVTLGNANNGQVLKLVITCDGGSGSGEPVVSVEQVTLDKSNITLTVDETQTLTATVSPDNASNKNVTWESSNETVATVSNAGLVTAVGAGDATITCKSVADNTKQATCAVHVNASPYTKSTLSFTAACGGSGTASDGAEWTVTSDGEESNYDGTSGIHYGTNSKNVTYLQLETSGIEGTVAKVVVNARDAQAKATISVTVGEEAFSCTNATATNTSSDYTFTGSGSGDIVVRVDRGSSMSKAIYVKSIVVYYIPAPQKTAAGLAYDDSDLSNLVKLGGAFTAPTLANPNSLSVAYASSNTDVAEVAANGAVTIKAVGVAEITASSAETETYKAGSAKYTIYVVAHDGTEADPYTVADARVVIDKGETGIADQYVKGIVSKIVTAYNSEYGNITYEISDDGTTEAAQLRAYRGFDKDGAWFISEDDVKVGDEVVVKGQFAIYGTIYELDANNQLVSLNRTKTVAGLEYAETAIEKNIGDAAFTNTLTNPNSLEVSYSSTATDVATVDENGQVTIVGMGTTTIKASFAGNGSYLADEVSYTLTVNDPSLTKVTFDATIDKTTEDSELSLTKGDLTIEVTSGRFNNNTDYRVYKNAVFTVSCTTGNIKRMELTTIGGNDYAASGFGTDVTDGVWSGDAGNVELTASGNQVRISKLVVYYAVDARAEAGLAYAETAIEKHVGDDAFVNTLTNPNNLTVAYESSNTDVAAVANDGTITIKAEGSATITASFEGNEDYKPASVSYELTVNEAGLDNVTFDAKSDYTADASTLTLSKEGFTLTFTGGAMNNKSEYRLYKDQTMTLSSTDYIIKKIEFTCSSGNPITGFANAEGLDKDNNQWTGEASKVELTASNKQVRIEQMIVYYVEDTRAASGLAWSTDAVEITLGDAFTAASLVNPNNIDAAEIVIESDNEDLATVNAGAVELVENVTGEATITATFAGNETYKPAEFSYTIKVNDPTPMIITDPTTYLNFGSKAQGATIDAKNLEVTLQNVAAATVAITGDGAAAFSATPMSLTGSGTIVVSASSANQGTFSATLTISDDANGAGPKEISLSLTVTEPVVEETAVSTTSKWVAATDADLVDGAEVLIVGVNNSDYYAMGEQNTNNRAAVAASVDGEGVLTPGEGTMSFTLVAQGDGTFALRTSNGKYLYAASSSSNNLKSQNNVNDNAKWTLSATSAVAESSSNRNVMQFNVGSTTTNPLFNCYASDSQKPIALYKKVPLAVENQTVDGDEIESNSDVVVKENGVVNINADKELGDVHIENGGTINVASGATLTVQNLYLNSTMAGGLSAQLLCATNNNIALATGGDVFFDITLGKNGDPNQWHAFTVPFPVDALNGIYDLDGNKLTNEVNYAIMDYHGDIRANGQYGWKKYRGVLVPGTFYLMTVDGERTTYRLKKASGADIVAAATMALTAYSGNGVDTDAGWNGVGNPTLFYGSVAYNVQVLNPGSYVYETFTAGARNFIVGTPFFIQASVDGSMSMTAVDDEKPYYAPARAQQAAEIKNVAVRFGNNDYKDRLYISANEDATDTYEIGKDLVKMIMTNSPSVAQIFAAAYGNKLSMINTPLINDEAEVALSLYAPKSGSYTISIDDIEGYTAFLLFNGQLVWNLSNGQYEATLPAGNSNGYSIVLRKRAPEVATGADNINVTNAVQKVLMNGTLYLIKDEKVFDSTGRAVK